jgi:uncharacterized protein (DUF2062 family)
MERFPRTRKVLEQLLHTHDTPRRTAAAFALGVFFGFSPFLGLHTVLGLLCAFLLNLNRVAVVLGVYSNLPWILPAYYTLATVAGAALLRTDVPPGVLEDLGRGLTSVSWAGLRDTGRTLTPLLWAFLVGSTAGSVILAGCAYRISLAMIVAHRRHHAIRHQQHIDPE